MFWFDLLVALCIALVITTVFVALLGWRHPGEEDGGAIGGTALFFFLILFVATWAGGVWLYPFGPVLFGGYLLPFLVVGLVVALVLAAAVPTREERWRWRRTALAGTTPPQTVVGPMNPATPTSSVTAAPEPRTAGERRVERARDDAFGAFFWILFIALAVAIFFTYLY